MLGIRSSLYHTFLFSVIGASLLMAVGIGYFFIQFEFDELDKDACIVRGSYVVEQKNKVKNVVGQVVQYVTFRRATTEEEIRNDIKGRVDEAIDICQHSYDQYHVTKSRDELVALIRESLRAIRYNNGRGYYFIYDMQGNTILLPNNPEMEGKNLLSLRDDQGLYPVQRFIQVIQEHGEGYLTWSWYKPGETAKMSKKIGYAKLFKQLDWFVGTGEYVEDAEKEIQKEILAFINTIRFDKDNYVFVYDFDAITLAHYKPQNLGMSQWDFIDPNGVPVVQELIQISQQPDGGFLRYVGTIKPETGKPSAKISYADSVPDWRWMIGAGVYVDDVEQVLEQKRHDLQQKIKTNIQKVAAILLLALMVIVLLARIVSSRIRASLKAFTSFFEAAALGAVRMDENRVHYTEFKHLVAPANRMLQERNKAQDAMEESEERLNRSKKMEALGLLAGGVAHDLNNVLSGIVSYPDLLLVSLPADSSLRQPLMTIRDSGNKAAAIVQDLLILARRGVVIYEIVNLNRIIEEYLASPEYRHLLAQFPMTRVETRLDPALLNIKGSSVHLGKSLMNLVSNAFEAQSEGGRILIVTSNRYLEEPVRGYETILPGEYVLIKVEDSGTGIAAEDIKRIFEPFYTKKVMGRRSGTGLGMAIVWGTLQDHQGFIDVKSSEGDGSAFDLYFPVTREEPVPVEMEVSVDVLMGAGEHILVIDDVPEQRQVAESILNRLGYQVTTVESGEAAVDYLQNHPVDLLVLDMIMDPGIDGLDTYRRIIELYPGQKALITSGYTETDRVRDTQRLGAGQYLRKPYTFKGLGLAVFQELRAEHH